MIKKLMMMFVATMAAMGAWAEYKSERINGYTWIYEQDERESYIYGIAENPSGTISFPSELGGNPVKNLTAHDKFQWRESNMYEDGGYWTIDYLREDSWLSNVTKVIIPEGVTNIYDKAFSGSDCTDVETGVRYISGWCNLKDVVLPDSLEFCNVIDVFTGTPFCKSDRFPDFVLSSSGKKLFGLKAYALTWDFSVHPDIVIPATVEEVAPYSLGTFSWGHVGNRWYTSSAKYLRIIFSGSKPKASWKSFADLRWSLDGWVLFDRSVFYRRNTPGWVWGENWCGVKTYEVDDVPVEYSVKSDLKMGRLYCGGMWDGDGYSEREIWEESTVESGLLWPGEKGGEYAFIPVSGNGAITPIIYGDKKHITTIEVWTDSQMFEKFTPKGISSSEWDDDEDMWEYESDIKWYSWPKSVWPDNKVVADRRWIVVGVGQNSNVWSGFTIFRVGISGTSELSSQIIVHMSQDNVKPSLIDFFRGMSITDVDYFNCCDSSENLEVFYEEGTGVSYYRYLSAQSYELFTLDNKALSFNVTVPSAGMLVIASDADDDDSPALLDVFAVTGDNIMSDVFVEKSDEWEGERRIFGKHPIRLGFAGLRFQLRQR